MSLPGPGALLQCAGMPPVEVDAGEWSTIAAELTRRGFLTASGVAFTAVLTGCASSENTDTSPETLDFVYDGVVAQIPANPNRVVVIEGRGDLEFALVSGYPVVASGFHFGKDHGLFRELEDIGAGEIEELRTAEPYMPNYEHLASFAPDLIIMRSNAYIRDFYGNEQIAAIAPILAVQCGRPHWEEDLTAQVRQLRRENTADIEIGRYNQILEKAKRSLGSTVHERILGFGSARADGSMLVRTNDLVNRVAADLGFAQVAYDPTDAVGSYEVSAEHLDVFIGADVLFVQNYSALPALSQSPTFTTLAASRNGQVHDLDGSLSSGLGRSAGGVVKMIAQALTSR